MKDRKGKTSPIRATGFNQPAQPVWATKLFFDGKLCIFLLRQQFSAADQGTHLKTEVCCPCPTYLSMMVPWDVELIYIFEKKGSLNLSNCPLELFGRTNFMKLLPSRSIQEVEKKSLKRLHVLNHMFIFNIFQFEATLGMAPPFEGLPSFFQDDGIRAPRRPAVSFVPRGLRIKLQLALSWFSPICRPTETENNVRMDTPPKKHGTETLLYLYNNI